MHDAAVALGMIMDGMIIYRVIMYEGETYTFDMIPHFADIVSVFEVTNNHSTA